MKFSEMPYERADIEAICAQYRTLTERVKAADSADETIAAFMEHEQLASRAGTLASLANIRHTINTEDPFYEQEVRFYDENGPVLQEQTQEFMLAVLGSAFRPQLEQRFGKLLFSNAEMATKCFRPEIIPELQEENRLVSEYQKLVASAQIDFDGKKLNISQLGVYKENPDREVRKGAYTAEGGFYAAHKPELDDLFDRLVKVRTRLAQKLGYRSFTEVAYLRMTRNCYDPAMIRSFRKQVVEELVPIVRKLKKLQSERIGVPDMKLYDDIYNFREGNPKPQGTPEDILAAGKQMYEEMSPQTAEFIRFLYDNELLDVTAKKGKAVGGYCTALPDYHSPFIFSNFNGTSGDVDVLTHEAGHAFAAYSVRNFEVLENMETTMESAEIHSMSMEFFAWPWLPLFYGSDADRARLAHLESALVFLPYGTMVDHFQHIVYDRPELTPAQRDEEWMMLEKIYRPYIDFDNLPFYSAGAGWQRQLHIYHYPFYYIDYCLAQTVALLFWSLSQSDYRDAWRRYLRLVDCGGTKTFVGLCETAGVRTPFEPGCLKTIAKTAEQWLGEHA